VKPAARITQQDDRRQMSGAGVQMTGGRVQATGAMVSERPALCAMPLAHKPVTRNAQPGDQ
jgi:hypothetical protein